jgi:hypothetical protein
MSAKRVAARAIAGLFLLVLLAFHAAVVVAVPPLGWTLIASEVFIGLSVVAVDWWNE